MLRYVYFLRILSSPLLTRKDRDRHAKFPVCHPLNKILLLETRDMFTAYNPHGFTRSPIRQHNPADRSPSFQCAAARRRTRAFKRAIHIARTGPPPFRSCASAPGNNSKDSPTLARRLLPRGRGGYIIREMVFEFPADPRIRGCGYSSARSFGPG